MDTKNEQVNYSFFESFLPDDKPWYSVKEVALILGKSDQYVRNCFDNQRLFAHVLNGNAQRKSYQISRRSLVLFLMETANYNAQEFYERVKSAHTLDS